MWRVTAALAVLGIGARMPACCKAAERVDNPVPPACDPQCPSYRLTDDEDYRLLPYCTETQNGGSWQGECAHGVTVCETMDPHGGYKCTAAQPYFALAVCSRHTSTPPQHPRALLVSCLDPDPPPPDAPPPPPPPIDSGPLLPIPKPYSATFTGTITTGFGTGHISLDLLVKSNVTRNQDGVDRSSLVVTACPSGAGSVNCQVTIAGTGKSISVSSAGRDGTITRLGEIDLPLRISLDNNVAEVDLTTNTIPGPTGTAIGVNETCDGACTLVGQWQGAFLTVTGTFTPAVVPPPSSCP